MLTIPKPQEGDFAPYYQKYLELVPVKEHILTELHQQHMDTIDLVTSLDDMTLMSSYAPGKWTIMDILQHMMDCERVYTYRALSIARGDKTPLPGFDENQWAIEGRANARKILNLVKEFSLLRATTIELFTSFDAAMWEQQGVANGHPIKVSAIPYILCGHEIHHRNVIEDRYIGKN